MNILEFLFGFPVSGCDVQQGIPYLLVFTGCKWEFIPYAEAHGEQTLSLDCIAPSLTISGLAGNTVDLNCIAAVAAEVENGILYFNRTTNRETHVHLPTPPAQALVTDITHSALYTLRENAQLVPGMRYRITNYVTIEQIDGTVFNSIGEPDPLTVVAIDAGSISRHAVSETYPQDIIEYDIDDFMLPDGITYRPGRIVFRHDTIRDISLYYDWRAVETRLYAPAASHNWNSGTTYIFGNIVIWSGIMYICYVPTASVGVEPGTNPDQWIEFWNDADGPCFFPDGMSVGGTALTLNTASFANYTLGNISNIQKIHGGPLTTNIVVFNYASDIEIGNGCKNIILNTAKNLNVEKNSSKIMIGQNTSGTHVGYQASGIVMYNNVENAYIGDYTTGPVIGYNAKNIHIGSKSYNTLVAASANNINILDAAPYNVIGRSCSYINIAAGAQRNTFEKTCSLINIGPVCSTNTFGLSSTKTTLESGCSLNTFPSLTQRNVIANGLASTDFTLATHIVGNYDCEIFKDFTGTMKLRYTDAANVIQYTVPNA